MLIARPVRARKHKRKRYLSPPTALSKVARIINDLRIAAATALPRPPEARKSSGVDDRPQLGSHDSDSEGESLRTGREARLASLRAAVQRGLDDVRAGRVIDLDEGIEQVLRGIREKKAAGRHG